MVCSPFVPDTEFNAAQQSSCKLYTMYKVEHWEVCTTASRSIHIPANDVFLEICRSGCPVLYIFIYCTRYTL